MKTSAKIIAFILTFVVAGSAFARLGETPQQLEQRYGAPRKTETIGKFTRLIYLVKETTVVTVIFEDGKSIVEIFAPKDPMLVGEAEGIVKTFADGKQVFKMPRQTVKMVYSIVPEDDDEVGWAVGSTIAVFTPAGNIVVWFADVNRYRAFIDANNANKNKGL
jgi:hypothetical protein